MVLEKPALVAVKASTTRIKPFIDVLNKRGSLSTGGRIKNLALISLFSLDSLLTIWKKRKSIEQKERE